MTPGTEQRKLAAIMFTDMVGYCALAQRNDALALGLLEEHRALLRSVFPRFNGAEIKTIGDAFLVEFGSALEAAQCAIEIQRTLAHRNTDVPAEKRIQVRIGIHIGDVVHREGDVYGDGVNIASRIEQLAGPSGICISMDVERQIRHALEASLVKLPAAALKNIQVPMDLFRIVLPWEKAHDQVQSPESKVQSRQGLLASAGLRFRWTTGVVALAVLVGVGVGSMKDAPTEKSHGNNLLAIAYAKAAEMAETLKDSGHAGRRPMTGETEWQGGLIKKGKTGYLIAAFIGGPSESDLKVSQAGLEVLSERL
jgi:class 3 adenylate cyclase